MPVRFIFTPDSAAFPSGSFPELKAIISGSVYQRVLAFDGTANTERALFYAYAASGWSGSLGACVVGRADAATTASAVWEISIDRVAPGTSFSSSSFATSNSAIAGTLAAGSGLYVTALTPDDDGVVSGDKFVIMLRRLWNNGSDTITGDYFMTELIVADGR